MFTQKPTYKSKSYPMKNYIEKHNLKLYLLADLIKMAGHDIGHLPLSHAMEEQIYSSHGAHEILGQRIILEESEIQEILTSISPDLPKILKELYEKHGQDYEIITPSVSILAQPSVAIVDKVVDDRGTREAATEYLQYLYSDEAQRIAGDNYYRPYNEDILKEYADVFNLDINLVTIQEFGGWDEAQTKHFADGGVFDEIYEKSE